MPFPQAQCQNCFSLDTMGGLHAFQCLVCGRLTDYEGRLLPAEPEFMVTQAAGPWRNNPDEE
jgi:hypothetical protein